MVFAFVIQTLDCEEPEIAYYRFYSTGTSPSNSNSQSCNDKQYLFGTSHEKKDLLAGIIKKVHMHYSLKLKQSLLPLQHQDSKTLLKGYFIERDWKHENLCIVWQGVPDIGFALVSESEVNIVLAQNILDLIVSESEKYLQIVSYPTVISKTIDSVALIVDQCLPGGQLLFLNSSLIKSIEKQLETNLQS